MYMVEDAGEGDDNGNSSGEDNNESNDHMHE